MGVSRPERRLQPGRSAVHRFGYELRKWRKARGLSQDKLGTLTHVSGDLIYRIELGDRRPARDLVERCEHALGVGGALLECWEAIAVEASTATDTRLDTDKCAVGIDKPADQTVASSDREMIVVSMMSLTGESVPVLVDRRTFVARTVSLPLVGWVGHGTAKISQSVPAREGDLGDIVQSMRALRAVLTTQDNMLGSAVVAPTVTHQLSVLKQISRNATGNAREAIVRLQAEFAEFAGWLSDELGDRRAGQYWTDRALEWSHEIDDELIIGYVLARKAQRAVDVGDSAAAISLARAAQRSSGLTGRVRAAALQYEAQGHASLGEISEFRHSIDQARQIIGSSSPASHGDWAEWCTPGYITMHEAVGWMRLDEPARAVAVYERGHADWPHEFQRDQGVYYGRLAQAHAKAGNPEEAADAGRKALAAALHTGSARVIAELGRLSPAIDRWRDVPAVKEFVLDLELALSDPEMKLPLEE